MNISTSLVTAGIISAVASYVGTLMLGKRMALVAGPLGHLTLPGAALALLYNFDITLGAFPFVLLGVLLIWLLELRTRLPVEALTAIVFATGVAVSFLFLPLEEAERALVGDLTKIELSDMMCSLLVSAPALAVVSRIYGDIILTCMSEDMARITGINVGRHNLIYLLVVGAVVALGVKIVGGLLTAALVAIPAAAARNISRSLKEYKFIAVLLGVGSAVGGVLLSWMFEISSGILIILVGSAIFLVTSVFRRA